MQFGGAESANFCGEFKRYHVYCDWSRWAQSRRVVVNVRGGKIVEASQKLKIGRATLYRLMQKYKITNESGGKHYSVESRPRGFGGWRVGAANALVQTKWNRSRAAKLLGIDRRLLFTKIKDYKAKTFASDRFIPLRDNDSHFDTLTP